MAAHFMLIAPDMKTLYLADTGGGLLRFDVSEPTRPVLQEKTQITGPGVQLVGLSFLGGGFSLVAADSQGRITQWFPVRKGDTRVLKPIREFGPYKAVSTLLLPEFNRRGFATLRNDGIFSIHYATSHRTLLERQMDVKPPLAAAFAPRNNGILMATEDRIYFWRVENHHPEVSWSSLWGKVWYEYYDEPAYTWQSSSAADDFEPKFSLVPVTFGTFKAAFYAMLFAVPLAILGAMYTANFMSYSMMAVVKPAIEIMGAMPTVILGFLAGIWFAPFAEMHIPGISCFLVMVVPAMFLASWLWARLPEAWRRRVPEGWEALLLLPVVVLTAIFAFQLGEFIENIWMHGDCRHWLSHELGIGFDQRNALIVGVAMGFAVIPPIFTITEDAIYGVPKHLIQGSLALGATPWQTMMRVVLPTASPAIFSAVMMGLGRAIGETMIVLMATGNTPVMDFSIFQGLRTLSANIAVEMPEAEVGSTHFRVLFLSGLTLFALTFLFNTLAEMVRHRLRRKYSSI
jgi:phosphate transport system permease protein